MKNIPASSRSILSTICVILTLALVSSASVCAQTPLAWWGFEGNTTGTNGYDLTPVGTSASAFDPPASMSYETASGINAENSGSQTIGFDGSSVLKTNDPALRLGGSQTFWLRVNLETMPANIALMTRSRALNGSRGISLQLVNGKAAAYVSSDGDSYEVALTDNSYTLQTGTWYDISLVYDASNSVALSIYSPETGNLISTAETTSDVPASISTTNNIGSGYFQVGAINNGSAGSTWAVPDGTQIESAGVWDSALSGTDIARLSSIPEPASFGLLIGVLGAAWCVRRR